MSIKSSILRLDISYLEHRTPSIQSDAKIPVSIKLDEVNTSKSDKYGSMKDEIDSMVKIFRL